MLKKDFMDLYNMLIDAGTNPYRYCVKRSCPINFEKIPELKCWECSEFVLEGGICDPL